MRTLYIMLLLTALCAVGLFAPLIRINLVCGDHLKYPYITYSATSQEVLYAAFLEGLDGVSIWYLKGRYPSVMVSLYDWMDADMVFSALLKTKPILKEWGQPEDAPVLKCDLEVA